MKMAVIQLTVPSEYGVRVETLCVINASLDGATIKNRALEMKSDHHSSRDQRALCVRLLYEGK
jgi:hypothetical protein